MFALYPHIQEHALKAAQTEYSLGVRALMTSAMPWSIRKALDADLGPDG